jgi:ketosteroid isomerase-like protein
MTCARAVPGLDARSRVPIVGRMANHAPMGRRFPILLLVLLTAACAHQSPDVSWGRPLLEARQAEFFAAMAARDADWMADLFADAAELHVANMPPVVGRSAIRQFYGRMFEFLSASTAEPSGTRVSASGDVAYSTGRTTNEFRGAGGPVSYAGKYVLVWERLADDWRVVLYAVSSNQPPPAPSEERP